MSTQPLDDRGSFAWIASPEDLLARACCVVLTAKGPIVIDPVDNPELDALIAPLGKVAAVLRLLNRHKRDCAAVAARHGVQVRGPADLGDISGAEAIPIPAIPGWTETALWFADGGLLVCPEAVGTAPHYLAREGDPLGVHPLLRLRPPRRALGGLSPTVIAVGHGHAVTEDADRALAEALGSARRGLPRAWLRAARGVITHR